MLTGHAFHQAGAMHKYLSVRCFHSHLTPARCHSLFYFVHISLEFVFETVNYYYYYCSSQDIGARVCVVTPFAFDQKRLCPQVVIINIFIM